MRNTRANPSDFSAWSRTSTKCWRLHARKDHSVTLLKALWHGRKIRNLRLLLYGIKEPFRNRGVDALMFSEGFKAVKEGYRQVEFSWILEDNEPVKRIAEMFSVRLYKKYRIFEKRLG
ncbi:MAG: hypothetical protein MZV70_34680 [Desulfobacterales bacterium]|nr:hypothetical protein [Desulfobacterales bacterium]